MCKCNRSKLNRYILCIDICLEKFLVRETGLFNFFIFSCLFLSSGSGWNNPVGETLWGVWDGLHVLSSINFWDFSVTNLQVSPPFNHVSGNEINDSTQLSLLHRIVLLIDCSNCNHFLLQSKHTKTRNPLLKIYKYHFSELQ